MTRGEHTTPPQPPEAPVESDPSNGDFAPPHPATDPVRALVSEGRLLLLVNLEGTLIDVAKPSSVEKWPPEQQHQLQLTVASQSPSDTSLLQLPGSLLWIKMRPGWQQCMYRLACAYALRLVCCLWHLLHRSSPVLLAPVSVGCGRTHVSIPAQLPRYSSTRTLYAPCCSSNGISSTRYCVDALLN